jgi:hypothetical protein
MGEVIFWCVTQGGAPAFARSFGPAGVPRLPWASIMPPLRGFGLARSARRLSNDLRERREPAGPKARIAWELNGWLPSAPCCGWAALIREKSCLRADVSWLNRYDFHLHNTERSMLRMLGLPVKAIAIWSSARRMFTTFVTPSAPFTARP